MDLETAQAVVERRKATDAEFEAAQQVVARERERQALARREANIVNGRARRLTECKDAVTVLQRTVDSLSALGGDALHRAVGNATLLHNATEALRMARARLERLTQD